MSENTEPRPAAAPDPDRIPAAQATEAEPEPLEDDAEFVTLLDTAGGAHQPSAVPVSAQSGSLPGAPEEESLLRKIFTGNGIVTILAVLLALLLGGLLIALTDKVVGTTAGYLFARPSDFLAAVWSAATELVRRPLPGRGLQPPRDRRRRTVRAAHGDAHHRHPADHRRPRRRARPSAWACSTSVRRARSSWPASSPSWVGFALHLPVGLHLLARPGGRRRRRRRLGRHRRRAQGPDRRARGHRHDHAQLHRPVSPGRYLLRHGFVPASGGEQHR